MTDKNKTNNPHEQQQMTREQADLLRRQLEPRPLTKYEKKLLYLMTEHYVSK